MADPTISSSNSVKQNWAIAEGNGPVTQEAAQQILDAALASGGISMYELSDALKIGRDAAGSSNLDMATWLSEKISGANEKQGSVRHIIETLRDLRRP